MRLTVRIKQKREQLLLQNAKLQNQLHTRINSPGFNSFLVTFVIGPFFVGAIARFAVVPKRSIHEQLYRAALPALRLWSLF